MNSIEPDLRNLPALAARLKDPDPEVRLAVVEAIIALEDPSAHPILVRSLFDEDKRVKRRCGEVLAKLGSPGMVALFERMLASDKAWMREAAAMGMGQFAATALVPLLERIARGADDGLIKHALAALERQTQKGNAAAATALAGLRAPSAPVVRAPSLPRGGSGRAREDSLGSINVGTPPPAPPPRLTAPDQFDLDAAPAPPPPQKPSGRTRQVAQVRPAALFEDMPPIAGPGVAKAASGAQAAVKDCPVCGDPTPVNAFRCPNCKEQLRPDAPDLRRMKGGVDESQLANWNARACSSVVDVGYAMIFGLVSAFIPGMRGWGGGFYNLLKDGMPGGQSWGKAKYKCRVVDATTGQPATFQQSVMRNLPFFLPNFLGLAVPALGVLSLPIVVIETMLVINTGIRMGDRIANTRVVGGDPDASFAYMVGRLILLAMLLVAGCGALAATLVRH